MSLHGKVAIVTGAAQGIGRAIAESLAQAGADIVIADLDLVRSKDAVAAVEQLGRKALNVKVNVADAADTKAMVDQVLKAWGKVDILVNNAGITRDGLLLRMKEEYKGGLAPDDQTAVWSHRQHCVDRRSDG
jgi:3-oxoacyl-[acyl-carrier protein] reductase